MLLSRPTSIHLLVCAAMAVSAAPSFALEPMLAKEGQAEAAIVIAPDASEFARWLAGELAGHLQKLSGAELPIVTANKLPAGKPLVVLGGPQANPLAAAADQKQLARFAGLKPDGFVLKRIELGGVPALLVGGKSPAAAMGRRGVRARRFHTRRSGTLVGGEGNRRQGGVGGHDHASRRRVPHAAGHRSLEPQP